MVSSGANRKSQHKETINVAEAGPIHSRLMRRINAICVENGAVMLEFHREDVHVAHTINNMAELEQTCVGRTADWLAAVKQPHGAAAASKASFYTIPPPNARIRQPVATVSCSELTGRCWSAQNQQPFQDLSLQAGSCRGGRKVPTGCGLPDRK